MRIKLANLYVRQTIYSPRLPASPSLLLEVLTIKVDGMVTHHFEARSTKTVCTLKSFHATKKSIIHTHTQKKTQIALPFDSCTSHHCPNHLIWPLFPTWAALVEKCSSFVESFHQGHTQLW